MKSALFPAIQQLDKRKVSQAPTYFCIQQQDVEQTALAVVFFRLVMSSKHHLHKYAAVELTGEARRGVLSV